MTLVKNMQSKTMNLDLQIPEDTAPFTFENVTVDTEELFALITDRERIKLIEELCCNCKEPGTIGEIRNVVNNPGLDD